MSDAMNAEEMIEYVLSRAEGAERERLERAFARRSRARRLGSSASGRRSTGFSTTGLGSNILPDLAQSHCRLRRPQPAAALDICSTTSPIRVPFRWADFAVAASIFIAGVLTLLPAIQRSRERMNQAGCVFNLQQLGNSLAQYASLHPFLPYPPAASIATPMRGCSR